MRPDFRPRVLWVLPALLFVTALLLTGVQGPYYLGNNMEDYPYLLNSVNLLMFHTPGHSDHPGITLQLFGAVVIFIKWILSTLTGHWSSVQRAVLANPEDYLHAINLALVAVMASSSFFAGRHVFRQTASFGAAIAAQGGWFLSLQALLVTIRVQNEPLLIACSLALMIPVSHLVFPARDTAGTDATGHLQPWWPAASLGVIVVLGTMGKITYAPVGLVMLLMLTARRDRVIFLISGACAFAALLAPLALQIPRMAGWFTALLLHSGRYGGGAVGLPATQDLAQNIVFLYHAEPLLFLMFGYYAVVLLFAWNARAASPPQTRVLARFLACSMLGIVLEMALVAKHPAAHYLVPAISLAVLAGPGVILLLRDSSFGAVTRRGLSAAGALLVVWSVYSSGSRLQAWTVSTTRYQSSVNDLLARVAKTPDCQAISFYRSSLPTFGLFFGNQYAAGAHGDALFALYPDAVSYNIFNGQLVSFGGPVDAERLRQAIASGQCVLMEGTSDPRSEYFSSLQGFELTPVAKGVLETLYRLKAAPGFRPLLAAPEFPEQTLVVEAEAFSSGSVERDTMHWGAQIGVIVASRLPAFAEYRIPARPGKYDLWIRYASNEARPIRINLNAGAYTSSAASLRTTGWDPPDQLWQWVGTVELKAANVLRIESASPFPHIDKIAFAPVTVP